MARKKMVTLGGGGLLLLILALAGFTFLQSRTGEAAELAFRNSADTPPPGWTGPRFELSHDYPQRQPAACDSVNTCKWLGMKVEFASAPTDSVPTWDQPIWNQYIQSILDYVEQGQDPNLRNEVGVRTRVGDETRWFHVPWMAYDPTVGREFVHGTTNERTAHLMDLVGRDSLLYEEAGTHDRIGDGVGRGMHRLGNVNSERCNQLNRNGFETWSVGMYNTYGGWSMGQAFPASGVPQRGEYMGVPTAKGLPFPEGTVVVKFLTTNAPVECVPYLQGSPEWQVNRHRQNPAGQYTCERQVQVSRLVQVDVAVVDSRSPTRWVYGTYAYNGYIRADNVWDKLVPVGLQWGSDPWTFPAVPQSESKTPVQSVLNEQLVRDGVYQHFGCNKRLAGPVDNPKSSCMSCHGSAYAAANDAPSEMGVNVPPSFGFAAICSNYSRDNASYFQNVTFPQRWSGNYADALNMDTSLQLEVAFNSYAIFKTQGRPNPCSMAAQ
jgi:hypothetical protein